MFKSRQAAGCGAEAISPVVKLLAGYDAALIPMLIIREQVFNLFKNRLLAYNYTPRCVYILSNQLPSLLLFVEEWPK
jgi:hypothetical protein